MSHKDAENNTPNQPENVDTSAPIEETRGEELPQGLTRQALQEALTQADIDPGKTLNYFPGSEPSPETQLTETQQQPSPEKEISAEVEALIDLFYHADLRTEEEEIKHWEDLQEQIKLLHQVIPDNKLAIEADHIALNFILNLRRHEGVIKKEGNGRRELSLEMQRHNLHFANLYIRLVKQPQYTSTVIEALRDLGTHDIEELAKKLRKVPYEPMRTVKTNDDIDALAEEHRQKKQEQKKLLMAKTRELFRTNEDQLRIWSESMTISHEEIGSIRHSLPLSDEASLLLDRLSRLSRPRKASDQEDQQSFFILTKAILKALQERQHTDLIELLSIAPRAELLNFGQWLEGRKKRSDDSGRMDRKLIQKSGQDTQSYTRLASLELAATGKLEIGTAITISVEASQGLLDRLKKDSELKKILDNHPRQELIQVMETGLGYVNTTLLRIKETPENSRQRQQALVHGSQSSSHLKDIRLIISKILDKVRVAANEGHKLIPALPEEVISKLSILQAISLDQNLIHKGQETTEGIRDSLAEVREQCPISHPRDREALNAFESIALNSLSVHPDHQPGRNVACQELLGFMLQKQEKESELYQLWLNQILLRALSAFVPQKTGKPSRDNARQQAQELYGLSKQYAHEMSDKSWDELRSSLQLRQDLIDYRDQSTDEEDQQRLQQLIDKLDHLTRRHLPPHQENISLSKMNVFINGLIACIRFRNPDQKLFILEHFEDYLSMVETYALHMKTVIDSQGVATMLDRMQEEFGQVGTGPQDDSEVESEDWGDFLDGVVDDTEA